MVAIEPYLLHPIWQKLPPRSTANQDGSLSPGLHWLDGRRPFHGPAALLNLRAVHFERQKNPLFLSFEWIFAETEFFACAIAFASAAYICLSGILS